MIAANQLAIEAITEYLKNGKIISPPHPLPENLSHRAGTFVSLHTSDGELRGCIGTILPTKSNIADEIISNAIAAATSDLRFSPLRAGDLGNISCSVDVLSPPLPVESLSDLNPKKYGVIILTKDGRTGLLLPDLPGINSVEEQLSACRQKAGIKPEEDVKLFKFAVKRFD